MVSVLAAKPVPQPSERPGLLEEQPVTPATTQVGDPRPCWFGPSSRPLFGWIHGASPAGTAPGVVLCPPLVREVQSAHYSMRRLADELAAAGFLVVRFDYDGTGDSAGDGADQDRVGAWLTSIELAAGLARDHGASSISLVGLRMGALLAELAARRLGDVAALVLWDPCVSGRSFVRQQRVLQLVETDGGPAAASGAELLGFRFDEGALRELAHLTVPRPGGPVAGHSLLLHRPKEPSLGVLRDRLGDGPVEARELEDDALLDVDPLTCTVPESTLAAVTSWLAGRLAPVPPCPPTARRHPAVNPEPGPWATVVPESPAGAIGERLVRLGPLGLAGIETAPARLDASTPTVLFLTTAKSHRIGPNRLWVDLARRWAGLGFRSVRFDLSGIGDSPVRPGQQPQVMRTIEAFDDVLDAARAVSPGDPSNVVLVGLCSGAYQALETGFELGPRAVLAVNPGLNFTPPEAHDNGRTSPRRRISRPLPATVRGCRRLVPPPLRRRFASSPLRRPASFAARGIRRLTGQAPASWLGTLAARGVDVYCVCGPTEGRTLLEGGRRALPALEASGRVRLEVLEDLDHALIPADQRAEVASLLTRHLLERFGSSTGPAPDA